MKKKEKELRWRAIGIIEGIAACVDNNNIAEELFNAIEMLDTVIVKENEK